MTLLFSIHYFLWYGSLTSILGYESVFARHYTNATTMQYGYLNMLLPFATVLVTPMICSLADRQRLHRSYFTASLVLTTIAMSFYALLPLIITNSNQSGRHNLKTALDAKQPSTGGLLIGPWIYYCLTSLVCDLSMGVNTCLSDSFAVLQAEERGTNFGRIIVWGTFGWASSGIVLSFINQWSILPRLIPGLLFGTLLLAIDVLLVTFWRNKRDFRLDSIPIDAAQSLTGSTSLAHKDASDYMPMNESARINIGQEMDSRDGSWRMRMVSPLQILFDRESVGQFNSITEELSPISQLDPAAGSSVDTINSELNDADTNMNEKKWQNFVRGPDLPTLSQTRELRREIKARKYLSSNDHQPINSPEIMDAETVAYDPVNTSPDTIQFLNESSHELRRTTGDDRGFKRQAPPEATSFRMQFLLLSLILRRRRSLIRYLVLFVLSGFFMSMHWNYFFLYLEQIYQNKFELISALSMVCQSILGELPFFILSRKVIDCCGRSHTLSISVISIGIRFLLYGYLLPNVSMYCIALADCFQGPNYGLFYVVMTEVGLEYSYCDDKTIKTLVDRGELDINNKRQIDSVRLSLRSTVQSVAFACYEGIGVGLGSLVGGWMLANYSFRILWLSMAIFSISVGLVNICIESVCKEYDPERERSERREYMEARRTGALKKMTSPRTMLNALDSPSNSTRLKVSDEARSRFARMLSKSAGGSVAPPVASVSEKRASQLEPQAHEAAGVRQG